MFKLKQLIDNYIDKKYNKMLFKATGLTREEIDLGTWECQGSPTKFCIYNAIKDSANDYCLFCGQPDERK